MDVRQRIAIAEQQTPRDERALASLYAERTLMHMRWDLWHEAAQDIEKSIHWAQAQNPPDEAALANWYATRASIRDHFGKHTQALEDIERSIAWFSTHDAIEESRMIALCWSRASIRGNLAIAAKQAGNTHEAATLFRLATVEMTRVLTWWEANAPESDRVIDAFLHQKLRLEAAAKNEPRP